jgi:hypothetical protein
VLRKEIAAESEVGKKAKDLVAKGGQGALFIFT